MAAPLTKSANGSTVAATVGTPVKIHLAGNPTTGYSWAQKKGSDTHAYAVAMDYKGSNSGMMGAGGEYHITVTPHKSGSHPVNLVYQRSFEQDKPPAEEFTITLNVS